MRFVCFALLLLAGCSGGAPEAVQTPPPAEPVATSDQILDFEIPASLADHVVVGATLFSAEYPKFLKAPLEEPICKEKSKVKRGKIANNIWPTDEGDVVIVSSSEPLGTRSKSAKPKADHVVRARFEYRDGFDGTIWTRHTGKTGLGLKIVGDSVQFVQGDQPLTHLQPVYKFDRNRSVEIVITMMGTEVFGQIHAANTGLELLTMHTKTTLVDAGSTFVTGDGAKLTYLATRNLCGYSDELGDRKPVKRFVHLPRQIADKPSVGTLREETETTRVYEMNALELETLYCSGIRPAEIDIEPAWKYVDKSYTEYRDKPPVRAPKGFRNDLSFKNPKMVEDLLRGYAAEFPNNASLHEIGRSYEGRPIWALAIAKDVQPNDPRPSVLLNGAHHGNEPMSVDIVMDAIQVLLTSQNAEVQGWLDNVVVWAIPMVNPDGAQAFLEDTMFSGRKNGRALEDGLGKGKREGVDLNRNYPFRWGVLGDVSALKNPHGKWYRGPKPASEPETQAMMALANREVFAASISYHTGTVCIMAPYTVEDAPNPEPNDAWRIGEVLRDAMGKQIDGRPFTVRKNIYEVEGIDQDWFRYTHGTVALLIEAHGSSPTDYCQRKDAIEPNRIAWQELLRLTVSKSVIIGNVVSEDGKPLNAQVHVEGQAFKNGESWKTRARDGLFARYVEPGDHKLNIKTDDGRERTIPFTVGDKPKRVTITMGN